MASEITCIFNRNSKCIFKGGTCDQDCDRTNPEGAMGSHEHFFKECLERGDRKFAFSRKVANLLLQFP